MKFRKSESFNSATSEFDIMAYTNLLLQVVATREDNALLRLIAQAAENFVNQFGNEEQK